MANLERKEGFSRWEKVKGLFLKIYGSVWVSREVLEDYEKEVDFGQKDNLTMWKYLEEAVAWGELEISDDGRIFKMTDKGRERWKSTAEKED